MATRIRHCLPDDLLVAEMHAIENANGHADFALAIAKVVCGADDFHKFFSHRFSQMKHRCKVVLIVFHRCEAVAI